MINTEITPLEFSNGRRLSRSNALRQKMRLVQSQLNKADEFLDPESSPYETLKEMHKLLKYFAEFIGELYAEERAKIP